MDKNVEYNDSELYPKHLVDCLKSLYDGIEIVIQLQGEFSQPVLTSEGIR